MQDTDQNITRVLDHGYVRNLGHFGSDATIVNAARISFDKEVKDLSDKDLSLINFLIKNKHDSPLRHCYMSFEIYAPLMIARQFWKHVVGVATIEEGTNWNESSRRYITENEEFYIPGVYDWRSVPDNKKQGSGEPIGEYYGAKYTSRMRRIVEESHQLYLEALRDGVAPEQARLLLPAYAMYIRWRWTASLNALLHFLSLRVDSHAQWEIQQYAKVINDETTKYFPITTAAWNEHRI